METMLDQASLAILKYWRNKKESSHSLAADGASQIVLHRLREILREAAERLGMRKLTDT